MVEDTDKTPGTTPDVSEEIQELGSATTLTDNARSTATEGNRGRT